MKKWMYLIGLAMVIIITGCNTMYCEGRWPNGLRIIVPLLQ